MDQILHYICIPLGYLIKWCYALLKDYGSAIILFTLATKIVLLPVSIWIHNNNIRMVKLQPDINFLKVKHYGDADTLADEQAKLYKQAKYRPMLSLVPLAIQILLLLAVLYIINHPEEYITGLGSKMFLGLDLSVVATEKWGIYLIVPALAGISSWLLCFTQNISNVLQHEQSKLSQYGTMVLSVGLSLYLGFFVPAGTVLYWVMGNLFSIAQMYILNAVINPKKQVDYAALEKSREELQKIEDLNPDEKKDAAWRENRKREKHDYKKFFKIVNKHLVIYSEKSGFYKYFKALIEELTARSNIIIHYVTNDPNDVIFKIAEENKQIKPYYIGLKKTIPLMMRLEADMVVMTTPDLDKYYLKKSIMKKDVEYVYIPHALMSMHMGMREGCLDAFDTIFCAGEHIKREMLATEKVYGLPEQTLVEFGYPLADDLIELGKKEKETHKEGGRKEILIAPTWNEDNILDSCIDEMLEKLLSDEYHITVRPHPEYMKRYGARMQAVVDRWADKVGEKLTFELDFSSNTSIYASDLMITDWSGISFEYSFATGRPVLFVNTKMKVLNPNWQKIGCEPIEITLRDQIGISIEKSDVKDADKYVCDMLSRSGEFEERIDAALHQAVYNVGGAAKVGAKYILGQLAGKKKQK